VGFAIPATMVRLVVSSARSGGSAVKRPWLGAKLQALTPELSAGVQSAAAVRRGHHQRHRQGPGGAGGAESRRRHRLGRRQAVDDPNAFDYRFTTQTLGGKVELGVVRGGKESKVAVALETAPELPRDEIVIEARSPFTGAKVANLSPALADELRLDSSTEGVVVVEVADGTLAQQFGFQRGDVLLGVNGAKIAKTADLQKAAQVGARVWRIPSSAAASRFQPCSADEPPPKRGAAPSLFALRGPRQRCAATAGRQAAAAKAGRRGRPGAVARTRRRVDPHAR
jgi:S1-C subfamily serine protease